MSPLPPDHAELTELLRQSLDRRLPQPEEERLQAALEKHDWLKTALAELQQLRQSLQLLHPAPDPQFTERVMKQLPQELFILRPLVAQWRSVAAAACIALLLGLGLIYSSSGNLEPNAILGLDQMELDDVYAFDE